MQRQVAAKIQNTGTEVTDENDMLPKIKDWINTRYARIYRSWFWEESMDDQTLLLTASKDEFAFHRDIEQLVTIFDTTNGKQITIDTVQGHMREYAATLDKAGDIQTGDPDRLRITGTHTVQMELSADDTITVVSSDNSTDISPNCVRVQGLVNGSELSETITLTGTTPAAGTVTFDANQKLLISVGTTTGARKTLNGTISAYESSTPANIHTKISPQEYAHKYVWFKVSPKTKATGTQPTWRIWFQRGFRQLVNDNDIPILDCCMEIVQGGYSDALREDGLEQEGAAAEGTFVTMVKELQATRKPPGLVDKFTPDRAKYLGNFRDNSSYGWI